MKILFCNKYNFPFSGTEIYLFEIMSMLRSRGHEVALFSMAPDQGAQRDHLPTPVNFKDTSHGIYKSIKLAGHAVYSSETRRRLRGFVTAFRPDVAHVRNIYHHLSPSLLWELRQQRIPVLYHLNDFKLVCPSYNLVRDGKACDRCHGGRFHHVLTSGCYAGPAGAPFVLAAEAYVHRWLRTYQRCVTQFLTPSYFAREKLIENGWDGRLIDVLYHPQSVPPQPPPPSCDHAPVFYFGRLSHEKGLIDVLKAASRLPNINFQIAGEGPQRRELDSLAHSLRLTNIEFLGQLNGSVLTQRIAASRFTIFPSLAYETFGKSILESYAQARPVIATDLGSRREVVLPGKTGLLYRAGDHEQLAEAIESLYSQPGLAHAMGQAGYDLARQKHSPETHYHALVGMYQRLADSPPARTLSVTQAHPAKLRAAFIGGRGVGSKYSGIESWYEKVGEQLADSGHEVTVYCRNYFTPEAGEYRGMRVLRLPTIRTKHLDTLVHTAISTLHAIWGPYDIVHFHALGPSLFSFLPRLTGKKTIVSVQGLDWQRRKWGKFASAVLRLGERAAVALPNSTIVVSRTLQAYYRDRYKAETTYIPNGTELRRPSGMRHLAGWNLRPGQYILFLGRFSPEKNCDLLIRAFENIHTEVKLVLAGGSSYSDTYAQDLRRHSSDRVILLDWLKGDALEELLTHAMLFVLPSDMEGLSLALLDAMSASICVLASDVPENRELVDGAGFTFRRGDEEDLQRKLRTLIADSRLRESAGRAGQARVREAYLWRNVASEVEKKYYEVLGRSKEPFAVSVASRRAA